MASRQEEKERRKRERLEAEQAAAAAAKRQRLIQLAFLIGGVLVAAIVVVVVIVVSGDDKGPKPKKEASGGGSGIKHVALPPVKTTDLTAAVKAAKCQTHEYDWTDGDRDHVADGTKVKYKTNPPSYGDHFQTPASDGDYVGQGAPPTGNLVHALEHGRVEIQYRKGLLPNQIAQLETLFDTKAGKYDGDQYELIFENGTDMPYAVAVTAWGRDLVCPEFNPQVFDAIRAFRVKYTQQGPEKGFLQRE